MARRQSTIAMAISSTRYARSPPSDQATRPESTPSSTPSVARTSPAPTPASRRAACSSDTDLKPWPTDAKGCYRQDWALARLKLWDTFNALFKRTAREVVQHHLPTQEPPSTNSKPTWLRSSHLLRDGAIHPVVVDRLPLSAARGGPQPHGRGRPRRKNRPHPMGAITR